MKYVQPWGISDPNAPYINGDPSLGRQGSIPPAAAFEHPMREIVGVIQKSRFEPNDADLLQMAKGIRSQALNYVEDIGVVNQLTCQLDPPISAPYTLGLMLRVKVKNTNTGGATLDAGGGRYNIKRANGLFLSPGDLPSGGLIDLAFDGAGWQIINFFGQGSGSVTVNQAPIPYAADTGPANQVRATFTTNPPITALAAGDVLLCKINNTNTGPTTFEVNGLPAKVVKARGATGGYNDLLPGDIIKDDIVLFVFDANNQFQIQPNTIMPVTTQINVTAPAYSASGPNNNPVNSLMTALARKRIASDATLVIQMGPGVYRPFTITHPDASRITVRGTMTTAAPPYANYAKTGCISSARYSDTTWNLANVMRPAWGTEIRFTRTYDSLPNAIAYGVSNSGGGQPTVENMLIVGDLGAGEEGYGTAASQQVNGVWVGQSGAIIANNIGVSLCGTGFGGWSNAAMICNNCVAMGCSYAGYFAYKTGIVETNNCWALSTGYIGFFAYSGSVMAAQGKAVCSRNVGVYCHNSEMGVTNMDSNTNGVSVPGIVRMDIQAVIGGKISMIGAGTVNITGFFSPPLNTVGEKGSTIITEW